MNTTTSILNSAGEPWRIHHRLDKPPMAQAILLAGPSGPAKICRTLTTLLAVSIDRLRLNLEPKRPLRILYITGEPRRSAPPPAGSLEI